MASFVTPSNVFEISALEISLSGAEWAETTEVHIAHQPSHLLEMQRLLSVSNSTCFVGLYVPGLTTFASKPSLPHPQTLKHCGFNHYP